MSNTKQWNTIVGLSLRNIKLHQYTSKKEELQTKRTKILDGFHCF